jgi:hypothetical protein
MVLRLLVSVPRQLAHPITPDVEISFHAENCFEKACNPLKIQLSRLPWLRFEYFDDPSATAKRP